MFTVGETILIKTMKFKIILIVDGGIQLQKDLEKGYFQSGVETDVLSADDNEKLLRLDWEIFKD